MTIHGTIHLDIVTVVGRKEIAADKKQYYVCFFKVSFRCHTHLFAWKQKALMPIVN
jgi:hypothetical protein